MTIFSEENENDETEVELNVNDNNDDQNVTLTINNKLNESDTELDTESHDENTNLNTVTPNKNNIGVAPRLVAEHGMSVDGASVDGASVNGTGNTIDESRNNCNENNNRGANDLPVTATVMGANGLMMACGACGGMVGGAHSCPDCGVFMHAFCGEAAGAEG